MSDFYKMITDREISWNPSLPFGNYEGWRNWDEYTWPPNVPLPNSWWFRHQTNLSPLALELIAEREASYPGEMLYDENLIIERVKAGKNLEKGFVEYLLQYSETLSDENRLILESLGNDYFRRLILEQIGIIKA